MIIRFEVSGGKFNENTTHTITVLRECYGCRRCRRKQEEVVTNEILQQCVTDVVVLLYQIDSSSQG